MVGSSSERALGRGTLSPPAVRLVNWPLRDSAVRAWLSMAVWAGVAALSGSVSHSSSMGALVFAALAVCSWRLWIPVRLEIGSKGITQTVLGRRTRIPWAAIGRYDVQDQGVLFLAESEPYALSAFRGIYVGWNDQREALLKLAEFFVRL